MPFKKPYLDIAIKAKFEQVGSKRHESLTLEGEIH